MNMDSIEVTKSFLSDTVPYTFIGGYPQAMAKRLVIGQVEDESEYICCLKARFNSNFNKLTHRDVTGALYGIKIEREKFGDLWVDEENIYLYAATEMADAVIADLTQIGKCTVQFTRCPNQQQQFKFEELNITVCSARLDNIISSLIHKSREKAQKYIVSGNVNVNHKSIEDCSFVCNNGNILSVKGYGRFLVDQINENPRTGKLKINVKKYI